MGQIQTRDRFEQPILERNMFNFFKILCTYNLIRLICLTLKYNKTLIVHLVYLKKKTC